LPVGKQAGLLPIAGCELSSPIEIGGEQETAEENG
jgi:hypothetical protein